MNILHISTLDIGGACEAALRLHKGFLARGHQSVVVVREKYFSDPTVIHYTPHLKIQRKWNLGIDMLLRWDRDYYFFNTLESVSFSKAKTLLSLVPFTPEVVILHWISRFVNMKTVYEIKQLTHAKIFWHMLDMAPITGGCHYAWHCSGYTKQCGTCPAIHSHNTYDLSYLNFRVKKNYLKRIQPTIIAPTRQLFLQAKKSALFKTNPIHEILLPIDTKIFHPGDKKALRKKFGIPMDVKVICMRSDNPQQKRKGFAYAVKSLYVLKKIRKNSVYVLIVGAIHETDRQNIPFPYTVFSSQKGDHTLGDVYRVSDVFLNPSIEDSGPMMVNEAIASGLPVVSFPVGVAENLVVHGKTGFIANMKNSNDMARQLHALFSLSTASYKKMAKACRQLAIRELCSHHVVKQYEELF